jgi:hypothetical protein
MLVCLGTALVCGLLVGLAAPQGLVGSVSTHPAAVPATASGEPAARLPSNRLPNAALLLTERLETDPRQMQADAIRWNSLSEPQRRAILDRYWRISEMNPADRDGLFDQYAAFRELPQDRQEFLRARAKKLKMFMNDLSAQDLAVLEGMSDVARAERLLELWELRHQRW